MSTRPSQPKATIVVLPPTGTTTPPTALTPFERALVTLLTRLAQEDHSHVPSPVSHQEER